MLTKKLAAAAGNAQAYDLTNSLQFDRADGAYLGRSVTATNRNLWTFSTWIKRLSSGTTQHIFTAANDADDFSYVQFNSSDQISVSTSVGGSTTVFVYTTATYSTGSWIHIVVVFDLSQSANDRVKIYADGSLQAVTVSTAANPSASQHYINSSNPHRIGVRDRAGSRDNYLDALLADVNFIDNQVVTPGNFGYNNGGSWEWKAYSGTYGTNGFRLLFDDATSQATLGNDSSGNGNDWTVFSLATTDQKTDIPA